MGDLKYFSEDSQIDLRRNLEERLDDVRVSTNHLVTDPENLKIAVMPYLTNSYDIHEIARLKDALGLAHKYHASKVRDSGDSELVHPLQTAVVSNFLKLDSVAVITALLHDILENNPTKRKQITEEIYNLHLDGSMPYILTLTPREELTDSRHKKESINGSIITAGNDDTQKKLILYGVKGADRLTNLLTVQYMKPKDGRTAEERIQGVIYDTKKNVLPLAREFDKISDANLELHPYMANIVRLNETTNYLSLMRDGVNAAMTYFQRAKPALGISSK